MRPDARAGADRPRRVLYVINDLALGGAQRMALHQASFLDRRRFTPEIASFEFDHGGDLVPAFQDAGIRVHRLRARGEHPLTGWGRLDHLLVRLRPDLVHTHLAAAGVLGRLAARGRGVPRIVTSLHNMSDWQEKKTKPLRWFDRRTLGLADAILAVSEAVRVALVATCPKLADRAFTVRNGVPLESLLGARRERMHAREALGYTSSDFVVGSVARLDPRKGLDVLIEAVARAATQRPELRLLLVGDGPERLRLETLVAELGLQARVRLARHQADVRGHLAALDLFAAPSRTEGLGVAVIEALAAGLPVFGSRVGGIPEVIEDGVVGRLLPPDDAVAWAEALAEIAGEPERLARWGAAGPRHAERFSLEVCGGEVQRHYARLLGVDDAAAEPLVRAA